MRRPDRGTVRAAGFVAVLTVVFLSVNTAVAAAADGSGAGQSGGLLAPLNVTTSEGVPLSGYQLEADGGSITDLAGQFQALVLGGLFTLVRLLAGLACWLVDFAFRFPLTTALLHPAQQAADAYNTHVVGALGLKGLLLGWAFVFALILFVRGKVGTGLGEIVLTLVIAAFAASMFIRPDYLLGHDGPVDQARAASLEVASITTNSYFGQQQTPSGKAADCDQVSGQAQSACHEDTPQAQSIAKPIQDALTDALVVKPYQLLEYGRVLDPKTDQAAYDAHLTWVAGAYNPGPLEPGDPCEKIPGPAKDVCNSGSGTAKKDACTILPTSAKAFCLASSKDEGYDAFIKDLSSKAGDTGKQLAAYSTEPSWDRVGGVLLLLIAVAVVALMVCAMTLLLLGTQAADVGAAAVGGIAWVWGMLPGPSRMVVWRWFGVFIVSILVGFVTAMAIPLFGIAVDVLLTGAGPNLMVERLLLLDALALAFLAFHRRLTAATAQFGQRLALRMRYMRVGGTHLPGDTSDIGAALAMHAVGAGGGGAPGMFGMYGGASSVHAAFGARHRMLGDLAAMTDGTAMPFDPGRIAGDAMAEGRRGIAPLALALRGAHTALIGPKPAEEDESLKLLRAIAQSGTPSGGPAGGAHTGSGGGAMSVDPRTGEILHDPSTDRPLPGPRIHAKASRLRAYRVAGRAARFGYAATVALPRNLATGRRAATDLTQDVQTQLKVAANHVRQDAAAWTPPLRAAARATTATGRFVNDAVDHNSQRLATAWQVNDPAGATRRTARDAAAGAALFTAPTQVPDPGPRPPSSQNHTEDAATANRRQVFDALMRLQRQTWDEQPPWGGDPQ